MDKKDYRTVWDHWHRNADAATRKELETLSETEREERFYRDLSFGTGGMRGETGVGSNRLNRYTIRQAAAGTAFWLQSTIPAKELTKGVLIAFDTRKDSLLFAEEAALSFCALDIPVYIFDAPAPVPLLSFTLKKDDYLCGIAITASHNPQNYNGFKLYNRQGGQLVPEEAAKIAPWIEKTDPFAVTPPGTSKINQLRHLTGRAENAAYLSAITGRKIKDSPLTVVATPLHGAAYRLLPTALKATGHHVLTVPSQEICDGTFATVTSPNPEDPAVFAYAEKIGYENQADLLFATDPDGDRCGVAVYHQNGYHPLSGNEVGALLIDYLLRRENYRLPDDAYIVKTVVSGNLGAKIAARHNIPTLITPTGFKYIGEALLKKENGTFLAGYEESGGFLAGNHAADKDGIFTAVLIAEAAAFYKKQKKTLIDAINELYAVYGYEYSETETFLFPGKDGARCKEECLRFFEEEDLPGAERKEKAAGDTLLFFFGEKIRTALRPSGTEPKLKLYHTVCGDDENDAKVKLARVKDQFLPRIVSFLPENNSAHFANNGVER